MTINSCYYEKEMEYNGEKYTFCLWVNIFIYFQDTAGQEKFNALTPIYYRDAKGAILVYDISIGDTFKKVKKWIEELKAFNKNTVLAIAGNKFDLKKFDIEKEEVIEYAEKENAKHFYTSAKTGEGLDEIFLHITKEIASQSTGSTTGGKNKKLQISRSNSTEVKGGCCK